MGTAQDPLVCTVYVEEWRYIDTGQVTFKLGGLFFPTIGAAKDEIAKVYSFIPA